MRARIEFQFAQVGRGEWVAWVSWAQTGGLCWAKPKVRLASFRLAGRQLLPCARCSRFYWARARMHARRHGPDFARPAIPVHPGPAPTDISERNLLSVCAWCRFILIDGHISLRIYRRFCGRIRAPIFLYLFVPVIGSTA